MTTPLVPSRGFRFRYLGHIAVVTGHARSVVGDLIHYRYESGSWRARRGSTMTESAWVAGVRRGAIVCAHSEPLINVRPWPGQDFSIGECAHCGSTVSPATDKSARVSSESARS